MSDLVNINVDGVDIAVPKGETVVDAAMRADVKIPVFCHHPKLEPVGMCRMCLVRIGMPMRDRGSGQPILNEDGSQKYNWGRGMQTGCTVRVSEGMRVKTTTEEVVGARQDVVEFLLSSHPLDCPVCDKGGECPLQNLTMEHGAGNSRVHFDDKIKLNKHVPLGDLIYLDRERCIQCARCIRFQDEVVDDPVIAFHNRGRRLEIVTLSDPGFDSYWSGNTTDICPVGALTSADFRFGARSWELIPVASIDPHGPAGANITLSTRREVRSGGRHVIKRIMPRQNEWVNEIWISDKTRFGHHFADSADRLVAPLVRRNGQLVQTTWENAISIVAAKLQAAGADAAGLAGERLSNEDYFMFQKLFRKTLGKNNNIDLANNRVGGAMVNATVGISSGSNLGDLGRGDTIVVVAADLHETEPIWWLRAKQAAGRGATLIVANGRTTRLDAYANTVLRWDSASPEAIIQSLPAGDLKETGGLVIFYGADGLTKAQSGALAAGLGNLLVENGHAGQLNCGLIPVWAHNNTQGALDMAIAPDYTPGYRVNRKPGLDAAAIYAGAASGSVKALYVMGADPVGDGLMDGRGELDFLVVQELFLTKTAELADVVLPALSWAERDGTFTSGERRIQRTYPAIQPLGSGKPDWHIVGDLISQLTDGKEKAPFAASLVFVKEIAKGVKAYKGLDYRKLAHAPQQFPAIGGEDLYYGGTSYKNTAGVGVQWSVSAEAKLPRKPFAIPEISNEPSKGLQINWAPMLYTAGTLISHSALLQDRLAQPTLTLHPADADKRRIKVGQTVYLNQHAVVVALDEGAMRGNAFVSGVAWCADLGSAEITAKPTEN